MAEVVVVVAVLVVIIVALNLAAARLRSRFMSWTFGRVTRSMSWMTRPGALNDESGEGATNELASIFGAVDGPKSETVTPPQRTGAGPKRGGPAIENLDERERK